MLCHRLGGKQARSLGTLKDLAARALDSAQTAGAEYGDVRVCRTRHQSVQVKNGRVEAVAEIDSEGFGVRVLVDRAWGFACSSDLSGSEADRVAGEAVRVARASAMVHRKPVDLGPAVSLTGKFSGPYAIDPFQVSLDDKIRLLLAADAGLRSQADVRVAESSCECTHWHKLFLSTEGAELEQEAIESGAGLTAYAVSDDDMQQRSFPNSFGREVAQAGWEVVTAMDLAASAPRVADEAAALLRAEKCPSMATTVVIDATQMALQIHESCGHPTELDRVLGTEAAYAGTSFMTPDLRGNLRYGSEMVNIVADATVPRGLGSFGYDDEGVPAQRVPLIDRGLFVGYLTSRETARELDLGGSMGAMRADGWARIPIIRMTNINLLPGDSSLEDMVASTKQGIYLETNRSWSIDDRRLNFQFGVELAREIKDGKLGRLLRDATYAGITPDFWNSCDAVAGEPEWRMFGVINCGKGQPGQTMRVGHGAAPARFQDVRVGIA
jgi:TldD protein